MNTWDDWSDYEVNKAAVKFLEINIEDMSDFYPEPYLFNEDSQREFNLCNSWADMGQIIVENKISLIMIRSRYQAVNKDWDYIDLSGHDDINACWIDECALQYGHVNPLRAAAIVFLMINGVNP